jgi:TRAP-type mannitol/chloroaromatic compound transport system permease small subunit
MSVKSMPRYIKAYVRYVDALNRVLGSVVMYLSLAMMALLLFGSLTRYVFNVPFVWIIEMAQFLMAAYYILGGGYSLQLDAHVRMDVLYERWKPRTRAFTDSLTAFFLVFSLVIRGPVGIALMLLQAISILFKDIARFTGREIA